MQITDINERIPDVIKKIAEMDFVKQNIDHIYYEPKTQDDISVGVFCQAKPDVTYDRHTFTRFLYQIQNEITVNEPFTVSCIIIDSINDIPRETEVILYAS